MFSIRNDAHAISLWTDRCFCWLVHSPCNLAQETLSQARQQQRSRSFSFRSHDTLLDQFEAWVFTSGRSLPSSGITHPSSPIGQRKWGLDQSRGKVGYYLHRCKGYREVAWVLIIVVYREAVWSLQCSHLQREGKGWHWLMKRTSCKMGYVVRLYVSLLSALGTVSLASAVNTNSVTLRNLPSIPWNRLHLFDMITPTNSDKWTQQPIIPNKRTHHCHWRREPNNN